MAEYGYIKIHRKLLDSSVWNSNGKYDLRSAWIDLLMRANFKDSEAMSQSGDTIIVHRGQLLTSQKELANRWGWSISKVHRVLENLKKQNMLFFEGVKWGKGATLVTIQNYSFYQDFEQSAKSKRNQNEIRTESERKASDAHLKKDKKDKKDKKEREAVQWED